ncbi:hypothetical protein D3C80_1810080 [compost metagenome]
MGGLLGELSAGLLLIAPPGHARHAAHPLADNHPYLITRKCRLQPLNILLIPEMVADRGQQVLFFNLLQQARRDFRA